MQPVTFALSLPRVCLRPGTAASDMVDGGRLGFVAGAHRNFQASRPSIASH
jgi:hypothetical protein